MQEFIHLVAVQGELWALVKQLKLLSTSIFWLLGGFMNNPFRILVKAQSKETISAIAPQVKLSRNTITKLVNFELPRQVKLETLDKLASHFGYRVEVNLVRIDEVALHQES